ncbi:DNA helicase-2 / ATP-dependent DNA helicase PcrA [Raineyella antarctica]|uniref:DNA 3'-5' helicase n=1 Tax=Raineyella antarctica TaxID=1577474 RepID=A0A1G6GVD6_9ACTN|nr:ATP-dependent DNA helicase [Raineyella antarctica]SDB85949.1 DNA helicase-2 / ATP-dependent DNA helicase PcrA [Raineyella antarctica]
MNVLDPRALAALVGIPFSAEQLDAITAPLAPGVIIAGAGTGKTTVMAARVVWLVASGLVEPSQVLGLTFTRKAAHELGIRIRQALVAAGLLGDDDAGGSPTVSTYDAFAGTLAAEHGPRLGVEGDLRLVGDAELFALADRVVAARQEKSATLAGVAVSTVVERVIALSGQMLANGATPEQVVEQCDAFEAELLQAPLTRGKPYKDVTQALEVVAMRRELLGFVADLWRAKAREGVVEFADRTALAARLAASVPAVGDQVREEFRVVLLDEYQDTSAAQTRMLASLFSGPDTRSGRGFPVTAVGDPLQAIYEWRGAAVGTIADFPTTFPAADGVPSERYTLRTNRRSGTTVLDVANGVSAPLRAVGGPACPAALVGPEGAPTGTVTVHWARTWDDELAHVVHTLLDEHERAAVPWSRMAVLARRNNDLAVLHRTLEDAGIPAVLVGLGGLLELPECQQVVAVLRLLHDVTDNRAALVLLAGPRWQLGPRDLAVLSRRARRLAAEDEDPVLLDAIDDPGPDGLSPSARERVAALSAELARLREHVTEPVGDLVARIVRTAGILPELLAVRGTEGADQLEALVEAVEDYGARRGGAGLGGLLAWFDAEIEVGTGLEQAAPRGEDAVQLMTVHRAKGLEWDVVLLPSLVDDVFPSKPTPDDWTRTAHVLPFELRGDAGGLPELAEATRDGMTELRERLKAMARDAEKRLGYVAVSRAKQRLHLSGHRWHPDTKGARKVSPFLASGYAALGQDPPADPAEETNPYDVTGPGTPWPPPEPAVAEATRDLAAQVTVWRTALTQGTEPARPGDADIAARADRWDQDVARVIARQRARSMAVDVPVPGRLSVTEIVRGVRDPAALRADIRRPMPVRPSRRATLGTRFHAWVEERFAHQGSLELVFEDEAGIAVGPAHRSGADEEMLAELDHLCRSFEAGAFAERQPHALEQPFALSLGGRLVRGRIDAVYRQPSGSDTDYLVVDWKTHRGGKADPFQLALYRVAAAQAYGVGLDRVAAAFYYVRADRLDVIEDLPGIDDLVAHIADLTGPGPDG